MQQQWPPPFQEVCRACTTDHQHSLPSTNSQKDNMDAPTLKSKHWHFIDYVIVRRRDRQDVRVTRTMYGSDCWTDHGLVVSKLNLRIQPVRRAQGKQVPKRLDVSKLKQDSKRQAFVNDICSRLDALEHSSEDVYESWAVFRDSVHSSEMDSQVQYLTNTKTSLMRMTTKSRDSFKRNTKNV